MMLHRVRVQQVMKLGGITIACALLLSLVLGFVDYRLAQNHHKPVFSIGGPKYRDGGSQNFAGFGYSVFVWSRMTFRSNDRLYRKSGPELHYWCIPHSFSAVQFYDATALPPNRPLQPTASHGGS